MLESLCGRTTMRASSFFPVWLSMPRTAPPSDAALAAHQHACEQGDAMYKDPDTGLYVMTSVYLELKGRCCGSGCRHCPFSEEEQREANRPPRPAYPYRKPKDA